MRRSGDILKGIARTEEHRLPELLLFLAYVVMGVDRKSKKGIVRAHLMKGLPMSLTVKELQKQGYRVDVVHRRAFSDGSRLASYYIRENRDNPDFSYKICNVLPRGGDTYVKIVTPAGNSYIGCAFCSPKDSYNKKLGVKIALGRALSEMPVGQEVEHVLPLDKE